MAGIPRPATGQPAKEQAMRPPSSRPSTRSPSASANYPGRSHAGALSPVESIASVVTATTGDKKRKERDFDHDAVEETNIHVVVRCRGRNEREVRENSGVVLSTDGVKGNSVELSLGPSALSNKTYHFDKVFSPAADQAMIYEDVVTPILNEVSQDEFFLTSKRLESNEISVDARWLQLYHLRIWPDGYRQDLHYVWRHDRHTWHII